MKGKIELSKDGPPTRPLHATAPPGLSDDNNNESVFPLTTSTPRSQIGLPIGSLVISDNSSLEITSVAPRFSKKDFCVFFPVTAVTSDPSLDRSITAIEPTPPVEPVTIDFDPSNPVVEEYFSRA